jgi:hypothetical protein
MTVRRGHYMTVKEDITHDSKKRTLYDRRRHYMTVHVMSSFTVTYTSTSSGAQFVPIGIPKGYLKYFSILQFK